MSALERLERMNRLAELSAAQLEADKPFLLSFIGEVSRALGDGDEGRAAELLAEHRFLAKHLSATSLAIRATAELAPEVTRNRLRDISQELEFYAEAFEKGGRDA